jgi:hypothetical protein
MKNSKGNSRNGRCQWQGRRAAASGHRSALSLQIDTLPKFPLSTSLAERNVQTMKFGT